MRNPPLFTVNWNGCSRKCSLNQKVNEPSRTILLDSCSLDDAAANAMIRDMPFLNGSIFHELDDKDLPQTLGNDLYLSQNPDTPGLFDILARYQWTLSETSGYSNEIAIDPNMLGQLFERLVLRTEGIRYERSGLNQKDA